MIVLVVRLVGARGAFCFITFMYLNINLHAFNVIYLRTRFEMIEIYY